MDDGSVPLLEEASTNAGGDGLLSGWRIVSICTLLSRILGMLRESAMAWLFGEGVVLDAFSLAFRIPNLARQLFGEGALTASFLPAYVQEREQFGEQASQRLTMAVFRTLTKILLTMVALAEIGLGLAWWLIPSAENRLLLELLSVLTPYLILICLAALLSAVLQAKREFLWPALLPVVLNLFWLTSVGVVAHIWPPQLANDAGNNVVLRSAQERSHADRGTTMARVVSTPPLRKWSTITCRFDWISYDGRPRPSTVGQTTLATDEDVHRTEVMVDHFLSVTPAAPQWYAQRPPILWIAVCLVCGGAMQLMVPVLVLRHAAWRSQPAWRESLPKTKQVFRAMLPIVLGMSISQFNTVSDSCLAWLLSKPPAGSVSSSTASSSRIPKFLESGTTSALYLGQRLYQFPLGMLGVALGTVIFPQLASHAHRGDLASLRRDLSQGLRLAIGLGIPAGVGLICAARPITAVLYEHGKFTAQGAELTSRITAAYSAGVWASISLLLLNRGFYAIGDRLSPMRISLGATIFNVIVNCLFVFLWGGVGLAAGTSLAICLQATWAVWILSRKIGGLEWAGLRTTFIKTVLAAALMSVVCLMTTHTFHPVGTSFQRLTSLSLTCGFGAATYFIAAHLLHLREPWEAIFAKRR